MSANLSRTHKNVATLLSIIFIALVGLGARLAWLQILDSSELSQMVDSQTRESMVLQSPRGTIYDRNGRELAMSELTKSLYVNPQEFNGDAATVSRELAPALAMKPKDILACLTAPGSFIWLKRKLEAEKVDQVIAIIKEHNIHGLGFVAESKRYYPNNQLAANILGFVGVDDFGLDGVEMTLDKILKGVSTRQELDTDAHGLPIFDSVFSYQPGHQEKSVYLTIDSTIQFIVEQSLDHAMARTKAQAATIIVMNPKTGEILAMASRPSYDPNRFYDYKENDWKNRAVSIVYEPGSTFKSVVAAAALQEKLVTPAERFLDKGYVEASGRRIQNWDGESHGSISFTDIIKYSINTGFVQVGMRLGAARLIQYAQSFGFGKATGIELPGEEQGILYKASDMRESDVATMSIGQSIAVTPLQLITAVSAIANDGMLLKPHIVKEINSFDGTLLTATATEQVRQAIAPETAKELGLLMEKVVSEGGGTKAQVRGYRFAGKTGTAQKLREDGRGYSEGRYIASFVGFGPVEDPQVAAIVVIDDPQGDYYGGEIAAPVFSEVMTQVTRYLGIRPDIVNESLEVTRQPSLALVRPSLQTPPPGKARVPGVTGMTMRTAGESLSAAGLAFAPVGTGIAVGQSIPPNIIVDSGAEITVYFKP
ncbi:MAG: penicillin-binding transpeptidase domain-containing protein [Negativicutes bacterium]|nr:penicillin-binding transpeptidase domain-containing protein [Negativicutes bacterium]